MRNFVELHTDGKPFLINIYWIKMVREDIANSCTCIYTCIYTYNSGLIIVDESYDNVRKMIYGEG